MNKQSKIRCLNTLHDFHSTALLKSSVSNTSSQAVLKIQTIYINFA